ncbi:MAG: DJ-1/PfpI family protein [Pseudomonas sp.]|uniref:DJ-1/PfpI family protein n=1 Tax=Pseudomonas sp. TaxID=306 RepID=UPI003391F9C7
MRQLWLLSGVLCALGAALLTSGARETAGGNGLLASEAHTAVLTRYQPRFGRSRPVVAVIGENRMTELIDYVVPYGILQQSATADVLAVATREGPLHMMPALRFEAQATIEDFDRRFPEGADYLIVPAVHHSQDAQLTGWVAAQYGKGATVIGVCDGVLVLGHAGLLQGLRATGHWYSETERRKHFPGTRWHSNSRYLVDGRIVTTSGAAAAVPASLALVEAIAGTARATEVARELGVTEWSNIHDSRPFRLSLEDYYGAARNLLLFWRHETLGIAVAPGVDEIALALTADAYSRTYRSTAVSLATSRAPLLTRRGLRLLPDSRPGSEEQPDRLLPALDPAHPITALELTLGAIAREYGESSARLVALQLEYPRALPSTSNNVPALEPGARLGAP